MLLNTITNAMVSSSLAQSNSARFSTSPIISPPVLKARVEKRQADVYPQDIAIDMDLEEESDDLMDVIAKF